MSDGDFQLEVETRVDAPPEIVFSYFTDPEKYRVWKGLGAELEPRPGGTYRVVMSDTDTALGEYVVVEPPGRVVFTWGWEGNDRLPPGSSTVEVTIVADGNGSIVRLRHSGLPDETAREMHREGWENYLPRLAVASAGGDPGPDPRAAG